MYCTVSNKEDCTVCVHNLIKVMFMIGVVVVAVVVVEVVVAELWCSSSSSSSCCCCCCCCRHSHGDVSAELWCCWSGYFLLQWQDTSDGWYLHQSTQLQGITSLVVVVVVVVEVLVVVVAVVVVDVAAR